MSNIYFDKKSLEYSKGKELAQKVNNYNIIEDETEFKDIVKNRNLTYLEEKKLMFFGVKKGKFLKSYYLDDRFNKIKEEFYLSYENNCPLNCLYCYLREYYNHGAWTFYINQEDMFAEIDDFKKKGAMISCGIVNDSFVFDRLTNVSVDLINYFRERKDLLLEFRTKTTNVENLLKITPPENIIVSFTFSPETIVKNYEINTSPLRKRIAAAQALQVKGYKIGVRIDPIIWSKENRQEYVDMIKAIFSSLTVEKIDSIGLGCFRYKKDLKTKVIGYCRTDLFYNEFVPGIDGKMRYFKPIRLNAYKTMISEIRKYTDKYIYLGMEPEYIWKEVGL